ncbi:hypothetical protein ACJJTC_013757 [Scirpophaga incertulas]
MHGMFSRLNQPMTENEKLEILLHNIRPCYATTLAASSNINSIDDLKTVCKNFENINARFSNFQEPPRASSSTIAPEFAYKYNNNKFDFKNKQYNTSIPNTYYNYSTNKTNNNFNEDKKYSFSNTHQRQKLQVSAITTHPPRTQKDVKYPECPDCHPKPSSEFQKN